MWILQNYPNKRYNKKINLFFLRNKKNNIINPIKTHTKYRNKKQQQKYYTLTAPQTPPPFTISLAPGKTSSTICFSLAFARHARQQILQFLRGAKKPSNFHVLKQLRNAPPSNIIKNKSDKVNFECVVLLC